jgi:DNA-binding NarL/FixJ family response regulator
MAGNGSKSGNSITILLIEDNPGDVRLVRTMLQGSKNPSFEVQHAKTLNNGLERLKSKSVDVVLLDLGLPDQTGFDTFFDALAYTPETPIIVLTGSDLLPMVENSLRAHAAGFLDKFDLSEERLVKTIRRAIARKPRGHGL